MLRKIYRRRIIGFVVICFLLYPEISIHAQSIDYYSEEQILTLFHNREYKALIPILISYTNQIEEHGITQDGVFSDTVYSGLIGLLVPSLLQNGEFRAADECLSKAILFLKKSNCSPNAIYPLYVSQGAIYNILGDYALESTCFSEAIKYLKMNDQYSMEQLFVIQGMLAASYRDQGELKLAKDVVDQILPTIQEIEFSSCNPVSVLNTAATIYAESGLTQEANKILKKTMSICSQDSSLISEYIQTATNLTILYTNIGEYKQALDLTLETTKLPMTAIEKQRFYSNIPSLAYYLGEEDLACEYAKLNSDILIRNIFSIQHSFSSIKTEKKVDEQLIQLEVMNGVLKKFGYNPIATKMGFNNSMFIKDLKYLQRKVIRHLIDENDTARILAKSILDLQDSIFYGISDDSILSYQVSRLIDLEKQQLRTSDESEFNIFNSYEDVINALSEGEAVIDIISYVGFPNMETDKEERLKLGALIAKPWLEAPLFVELCDDDSLRNLAIRTIMDGAMGYNNLYADSTKFILYNLLFKNIEPLVADSKVLFISPKLLTNHINWGWIKCPDGLYLNDKYSVRIVASPSELIDKVDKISINDVTVFGGPDFSQNDNRKKSTIRDIILSSKGVNIDYLPGSLDELKEIQSLFSKTDIPIRSYSGDYANEKNFRELSGVSPSIVHVATHAYYLVGFANKMTNYLSSYITRFGNDASMIYSGLLLSCAKNSIENGTTNIGADDGILTSEEISYMDFSNTQLVVLSACNSGEGVSVEGYGGLPKAFRLAGAKCVLMSLWDISDELTSQFMKSFYTHLIQTKAPYLALKNAQYEMMSCYKDPYYWASFVLLE